ncbi:MAG: hypothetical protein HeimC2_33170 [Candidatus Heimdallarchaeota archaeon LC_2]|nr:MAG: hypothetical protein HeimC2_35070 [Candidatus Heimdallarchaeota archaeon LC_2]OLS21485.1 MAG: hypothetical protein HeimC2_33170 [Candidatus Heimdallarchaeota archaeon LC_2]
MGQPVGIYQLILRSFKSKKLNNLNFILRERIKIIYSNSYISSSNTVNSTESILFSWWFVNWQVQF